VTPPIIVADGLDLQFYSSVREAEISMEAVDVEAGSYTAWDSLGQVLEVRSSPPSAQILQGEGAARPNELATLLQRYLHALGRQSDAHSADLSVLLAKCVSLNKR
jgi:hypothetical protein